MDTNYIRASDGNGPAVAATVSSDRPTGSLTLIVDSVLNWPHRGIATAGTPVYDDENNLTDITDPTVFKYHLDGSIIEIDEFAPGYTDRGNEVDQVVILKPTTHWADTVAENIDQRGIPSGGTEGQVLIKSSDSDYAVEWGNAGGVSIISKETPSGAVDGVNTTFTTNLPYVGGSLQVYVNGLAQSLMINETNPAAGEFTIDPPDSDSDISVSYQFSPVSSGNADTLDGYHASSSYGSSTIPVLDGNGKMPVSVLDTSGLAERFNGNNGFNLVVVNNTTWVAGSTYDIEVGDSGILVVATGVSSASARANGSFALSGANTLAVRQDNGPSSDGAQRVGMTKILTGLNPGITTITQYANRPVGTGNINVYIKTEAFTL